MTAKEKAKELISKFEMPQNVYQGRQLARLCALIAVDEILADRMEMDGMRVINNPYWLEVKQEIEKL